MWRRARWSLVLMVISWCPGYRLRELPPPILHEVNCGC